MSWAEVKKINSDMSTPLDTLCKNLFAGTVVPEWLFTETRSWTPPEAGTYLVCCVGAGGKGGAGAWYCSGGAGGAGGVGVSILSLTKKSYPITINANTSFSTLVSAAAGGDGGNYRGNDDGTPGNGGTASAQYIYPGQSGVARQGGSVGLFWIPYMGEAKAEQANIGSSGIGVFGKTDGKYGAGGGAGYSTTDTTKTYYGADGAPGCVFVKRLY